MYRLKLFFLAAFLFSFPVSPALSGGVAETENDVTLPRPRGVLTLTDVGSDDGSSIIANWVPEMKTIGESIEGISWSIEITQKTKEGETIEDSKSFPVGENKYNYEFSHLEHGSIVKGRVKLISADGHESEVGAEAEGIPRGNWFNTRRINVLVAILLFLGLVVVYVEKARRGHSLYIRRIAGLDAVEEAVGRATEMGRPILYVPGLSSMTDVATIAALNILDPIARKAASYETRIIVPNRDPIVYTVAKEVVENAFSAAGRPDMYSEDSVFFITDSQFGYAAAVDGIIVRERPATNFYLGMFWAESLVMAETGAATGAIQIAGTDSITQLPFFIVSCDYTLIGEELYAASAYLSQEPVLLGTLKSQDLMKILLLIAAIAGIVTAAFGNYWLYEVFGLQ